MSFIGLDVNSSRIRGVYGAMPHVTTVLRLEADHAELPLAVSLEERYPGVGRPGAALVRKAPDLACLDFLPHLGNSRYWSGGRHKLDAARALALVFEHLLREVGKHEGMALAVPPYLAESQIVLLARLAEKARLRLLGTVPTPVAATLAAQEQLPWTGQALVVDVDGHALTWSVVSVESDRARLLQTNASPALAQGVWLSRLLTGVARRFITQSRRDPRESAEAEQLLHDQLSEALETPNVESVQLVAQMAQWYHRLSMPMDELIGLCESLVRQTLTEMQAFLQTAAEPGGIGAVLVTASAARLPGLAVALQDSLEVPDVRPLEEVHDFGENLLLDDRVSAARLHLLDSDAVARAAHDVALRLNRRDLPRGHLDALALPTAPPPDAGPPRLHFRDQDYPLADGVFRLGRDPNSDLYFDTELYPTVSQNHCEVSLERRGYVLHDRSRHGTLVNERPVKGDVPLQPGDWIRLGPAGPVVRFLGQARAPGQLMTTA